MNMSEFYLQRWESEQPIFAKVLRALPGDRLSYCPHERSTKAGDLAWQLVEEQRVLSNLLDTGKIEWEPRPRPETIDEIAAAYDQATSELRGRLQKLNDSKLAEQVSFNVGGESAWSDTLSNMLWGFLFDMVHHRGQLSSYLRPMGGKVPAIYGPSADDAGGA